MYSITEIVIMISYYPNLPFCTYLTTYSGNKLPPLYIGSTSYKRYLNGYHGTVTSKEYKPIWKAELKNNPHLFSTEVLSFHNTREEATIQERALQIEFKVVKNSNFINKAIASANGFFGMDVSGKNNPRYGKSPFEYFTDDDFRKMKNFRSQRAKDKNSPLRKTGKDHNCFGRTGEKHPMFGKHGVDNPNTGKRWITNGVVQRFVSKDVAEELLKNGFRYGQTKSSIERVKSIPMEQLVTCPHCSKIGKWSGMHLWHFDKCRTLDPDYIPSPYILKTTKTN